IGKVAQVSPATPTTALDRAVAAMRSVVNEKLLKDLRHTLFHPQFLHRRHPRYRDAFAAFYQALAETFTDGSITQPTVADRRCHGGLRVVNRTRDHDDVARHP